MVSIPDEWSHCILQSANFLYFSWSWSEQVKLRKAKNTECANNNITENIPQFYANSYVIIISNTHTYTQNWSISRLSFYTLFSSTLLHLAFQGVQFHSTFFFSQIPNSTKCAWLIKTFSSACHQVGVGWDVEVRSCLKPDCSSRWSVI